MSIDFSNEKTKNISDKDLTKLINSCIAHVHLVDSVLKGEALKQNQPTNQTNKLER